MEMFPNPLLLSMQFNQRSNYKLSGLLGRKATFTFASTLFLLIGSILFSPAVYAQIPANCGTPSCTSNDVKVTKAYISDLNGKYPICIGNEYVNNLYLHLILSTNTKRYGVFVSATLNVKINNVTKTFPITQCFSVALNGSNNDLPIALPENTYQCGSEVTLTDVFTSWGTGTTNFCPGPCPATSSKCRFVTGEVIFVQTTPCTQPIITQQSQSTQACTSTGTSFSVVYTPSADPTVSTSVKWQISNDNGSTWSYLTNTAPYSTVSTATLNISDVSGLNNKQYRAEVLNTSNDPNITPERKYCPVNSSPATLTVNPALPASVSISSDATDNTICAGTAVTFTATPVNGGSSPTYLWKKNGNTLTGVTGNTYNSTSLANGDVISVVMTSNATPCLTGSPAISSGITMIVNPNLPASVSITSDAVNNTICKGTTVTFTATPSNGGTAPSYQWKKNGTNIPGATEATYSSSTLADGDVITIEMTSNATPCLTGSPATSSGITMTVNPPLPASVSIAASPAGPICQGTSVTFTATPVNGGSSPTYLWKKNGNTLTGVTGNTYNSTSLANGDVISVVMTSNATPCLTGSPAPSNEITMVVNPLKPASVTIASNATNNTICAGTSVTFTATPYNGGSAPVYQWKRNGSNVGLNSATFTSSSLVNGDVITVEMTSNATPCLTGSPSTSSGITMTVNPLLPASVSISSNVTNNTICAGGSITFTAIPGNGGTAPSYQWKKNGVNTGSNSSIYIPASLVNGDMISVVMTSNATPCLTGSPATSNTITVTVNEIPGIYINVTQQPGCSSSSGTLEVKKNDTENYGTGYTYSYDGGNTWIAQNSYTFKAGAGYNILVQSPGGCKSAAAICQGETHTNKVDPAARQSENLTTGMSDNNTDVQSGRITEIHTFLSSKTRVLAAPNPFSDKVRFTLQSEVSGQASLEIYNTMGQKMATLYQGYIDAGKPLVKEYTVPESRRSNLIYVFRVGDQKTTGKLLDFLHKCELT